MSYETLLIEDRKQIRIITINRPKALNALSDQVIKDLHQALGEAENTKEVRALVITGAGDKAFVAGADIPSLAGLDADGAHAFSERGHALGNAMASSRIPIIAAVNGFALGGGCELALACDFIYASDSAKFGQPEIKLGVIPGFGGTQRFSRRVGLARAIELCLTGEVIDAPEALRIGLVNKVVPANELLEQVIAVAEKITAFGALAVAKAKRVLHQGASMPLDQANKLEARAFGDLFATADQKEGMRAFLDKRPPNFTGA